MAGLSADHRRNARLMHSWVAFTGFLAFVFGLAHITGRTAVWSGDWGSPRFEVEGTGAVVQGTVEVILGILLLAGSALDYWGIVSFGPVMNAVKAFLEF